MKDSASYKKLWQSKMQELPLEGDADASWQKMQALLDVNMPVKNTPKIHKLKNLPGSALSVALIIAAAVALLYFAGRYFTNDNKAVKNNHQAKNFYNKSKNELPVKDQYQPANNNPLNKQKENDLSADSIAAKHEHNNINDKKTTTTTSNRMASTSSQKNQIINNPSPNKNSGIYNIKNATAYLSAHSKNRNLIADKRTRSSSRTQNAALETSLPSSKPTLYNKYPNKNYPAQADTASATRNNHALAANNSVINTGKKPDSAFAASKVNAGNTNSVKPTTFKSTPKPNHNRKTAGNLSFGVDVKLLANSQEPGGIFLGIAGTYYFTPKLDIGIGTNILSPRTISGSYTNSNLKYITIGDSAKKISHSTGKIIIGGSRKIYTVDVPVIVSYKATNIISFNAGPVFNIPVKTESEKNNLKLLTNTSDTTSLKEVSPYVSNTTINNKFNFSLSGGVRINVNRFFIDAAYMQSIMPYTISSGLGSGKIYYHTVQFGIGYQLFKKK